MGAAYDQTPGTSCSVVAKHAHRRYSVARGFTFTRRVTRGWRTEHCLHVRDHAILYETAIICWVPGITYSHTEVTAAVTDMCTI